MMITNYLYKLMQPCIHKFACSAMLLIILFANDCFAQNIDPKFQAVFINGVARKISWSSTKSNFNIVIVGNNKPLENELKNLSSARQINNKSVKITTISEVTQALTQDIIFVTIKAKSQLSKAIELAGPDSMIMTAYDGGISAGSHINFFLSGNKISFDLNKSALDKKNIGTTEDLIKLASTVK